MARDEIRAGYQLPRHVRQYVEKELYDFPFNEAAVRRYEQMVEDVVYEKPVVPEGGGRPSTGHSDPTGRKGVRLALLAEKYWSASWRVEAIREVMKLLTEEERQIVRMRYFERAYTHEGIMFELGLSRGTYFRRLNEILRRFALALGVL